MSVVSEEKRRSDGSQIFLFNSSEVNRVAIVVSEEKQGSEHSQIFHFNSSEVKQRSERSQ